MINSLMLAIVLFAGLDYDCGDWVAVPCPDGIAGCTVFHTAPTTPVAVLHNRFWTDPVQPCEICAWYGVVCTNSIERHHLLEQSTIKKLGILELIKDERLRVFVCDCERHHCHYLWMHQADFGYDNTRAVYTINWMRLHPRKAK